MRKALASKMLRPKDVRDNMENFTAVTRDAIEHMVSIRGADMEIPDLSKELAQWATECKCLVAGVLIQLPGSAQLNKRRSAEKEVAGSNSGRTNTQGLKITEENALPLLWHLQMVRLVF